MQTSPLFAKPWIEPHLFWLSILLFAIAFWALRRAERRERQWAEEDEEEMRKHEAFKKAMDK